MYQFCVFILFMLLTVFGVKAQSSSNQNGLPSQDIATNFQPSLAVVIGILSIMFSLTFILLVYAKFCHRASSANHQQIQGGLARTGSRLSGIDKTVIESLPYFRFSSLKGSREGLECAVCLSKFEDIEILRLLPKCKHAFHIDCVDKWLERHSSCPLCRQKVTADDLSLVAYSHSLRFLWNNSEAREDSNMELFVQREEEHRGSSRFSIGNSFRTFHMGKKQEELLIPESSGMNENPSGVHKHNHKIFASYVVLKHRWSNVNSSDLLFLNSEMLNTNSSYRFSSLDSNDDQAAKTRVIEDGHAMNIREEMGRKREFESKFSKIRQSDSFPFTSLTTGSEIEPNSMYTSNVLNLNDKRSMSEITVHPRFKEFNLKNRTIETFRENYTREEKMRKLWLPIVRRTVEWFATREAPGPSQLTGTTLNNNSLEQPHSTRDSLNV